MLLYNLKSVQGQYTKGYYFAFPVITQTVDLDGLAEHMANHNTPYSKGAIKGILTDMVTCIKELTLNGSAVKIPDLAIFSIGIKHKQGADTEESFSVTNNIEGVKLRARGTGEFSSQKINLAATLKKVSINKTTTASGGSSSGGGTSSGGSSSGGGTSSGGSSTDKGDGEL